jgi:serine protease DegQ
MTVVVRSVLVALWASLVLLVPAARAGAQPVFPDGRVPSLAPLIEDVTPAVVNIAVMSASPEEDNPLMQDPFFRRFFGLPDRPEPQLSAGSGVIVDATNGYVLTNHHVIKGAREVMVTLKDRRQLQAQVVGSDAGTDIAVLRIPSERLKRCHSGIRNRFEWVTMRWPSAIRSAWVRP